MTKHNKRPMFSNAGIEMTRANKSVRIPRAPLTKRRTLPTFTTLTILNTVGEKFIRDFMTFSKITPSF